MTTNKRLFSYEELKKIVEEDPSLKLETKALICCQYALACRIGELLKYKHKNGVVTPGLLKSNIIQLQDYIEFSNISVFKNNSTKTVLVPKTEKWLIQPIQSWLNICNEQVFPFKQSKARTMIRKALGRGSHQLRHARSTHLSEILNPWELREIRGDKNLNTSITYVHNNPLKILDKISKKFGQDAHD